MKTINIREVPLSEIIDLPVYPVAEILPMLEKNASKREEGKTKTITLSELADSINEHGLQEPIVLFDSENGKFLLDGRNRRVACIMAAKVREISTDEFMVLIEDFEGSEEEADEFVFTAGLDRRDLEATQRAMSAAMFEFEPATVAAFGRMKERAGLNSLANLVQNRGATGSPSVEETGGKIADLLAKRFRVSSAYIRDARRILKDKKAAREAAERAAQRAEEYKQVEEEAKAELQQAVAVGDHVRVREAATRINNAAVHKVEEREKAAEFAQEASQKATLATSLHEGRKKLSEVRTERKEESESKDPLGASRKKGLTHASNLAGEFEFSAMTSGQGVDECNFWGQVLSRLVQKYEAAFGISPE